MSKQPKIPSPEIRARHISKLRELNKRMDKHILDMDELNAQLEANLREQYRKMYQLREQKTELQ